MPSDQDHVKLLLSNARQMLTLVEATFPHESFSDMFSKLDCVHPSSTTLRLACKWRRCMDIMRTEGAEKPVSVFVPALLDVS